LGRQQKDLKVSVIDLGFNSAKLANYHVDKDNSYAAYNQEGVTVRLGEGLDEAGHLSRESIYRTINALKLFKDIINLETTEHVLAVATSAVREATNRQEFLKKVYQETGFQFRVLSGKEESLYSYLGALKSTCIRTALFFDLGGGSLEMVYTENFKIKKLISLPLGALRLSRIYKDNGNHITFTKKNYSMLEQYILEELPDRSELDMSPDTTLVGVGGTLRAIARYDQEIQQYILDKIHNYRIDHESIDSICKKFYKMTPHEIAKIDAIGNSRAETITSGACTINMLMQKLGFNRVVVSAQGLREGVLLSFLESPQQYCKEEDTNQSQIENYVRVNCELGIIPTYSQDLISPLVYHGMLREREYEILNLAVKQISKTVLATNIYNLFYMIMDEDIAYLSHSEQLVLALSIIHTKKPKIANRLFKRYETILQSQNRRSIEKISACIVILGILERYKCNIQVTFCSEKKKIAIAIIADKDNLQFPKMLFNNAIKKFESVFDISVDFSLSYKSGGMIRTRKQEQKQILQL
jgi:exopolyphosphatase/guanosine-5'-triphosphate,3'-diphosphate pyrophosphatase